VGVSVVRRAAPVVEIVRAVAIVVRDKGKEVVAEGLRVVLFGAARGDDDTAVPLYRRTEPNRLGSEFRYCIDLSQ